MPPRLQACFSARFSALAIAVLLAAVPQALDAEPAATSREMILADPAAPVGGSPTGDVTIVAFTDYNCGFCKRAAPALDRLVRTDGRIRLVYKDWPILSETSVVGAKLALAAKYQGKYEAAHKALMGLVGAKVPVEKMTAALVSAGVDMTRLKEDGAKRDGEITALLKRNDAQARGMQFAGTPVYLVGPLKVAAALDYDGFRDAVAQARARGAAAR
jgi:protein-disulfide isomerase